MEMDGLAMAVVETGRYRYGTEEELQVKMIQIERKGEPNELSKYLFQ